MEVTEDFTSDLTGVEAIFTVTNLEESFLRFSFLV